MLYWICSLNTIDNHLYVRVITGRYKSVFIKHTEIKLMEHIKKGEYNAEMEWKIIENRGFSS